MSTSRCLLSDLIRLPVLVLYLLDSQVQRDRQDLVDTFCEIKRPEAIRHLAVCICACWNALLSTNPSQTHTMPGGIEDFIDDVEDLSLPWWYKSIAFTSFLLRLLGVIITRLVATLKWIRLTFNEHFEFRPIDIIGIALFALVAHVLRKWRPYFSPALIRRKISIRMPFTRLPAISVGRWVRHTSTIQQYPLEQPAWWRLAKYAETDVGAGTRIMTGLCTILAIWAIVYWLVEGRCRNVEVMEIEYYEESAGEDEKDIDDLL